MAFKGIVTGNLGQDPNLKFTGAGKPVCDFSIAATASRKDPQSQQWSDDGAQLWIRVSLWDRAAEIAADHLRKGDRVSVEGTLVLREYQRRDGGTGLSYELAGARLLGIIPKSSSGSSQAAYGGQSAPQGHQHPANAPWGQPAQDTGAPF